jgi:hypothetical protein
LHGKKSDCVKLSAGPQAKSKKKIKKGETNHSGGTWKKASEKGEGAKKKEKGKGDGDGRDEKRIVYLFVSKTNWDIV